LTNKEYERLESYCAARVRALLKGTAHTCTEGIDGVDKHQQLSNRQVFKTARIAPPQVELLARRLRWYSTIARFPQEHAQLIAAAFGRMEQAEDDAIAIQPPLDDWREYRTTGREPTWALRIITDIVNLARIDELCLQDLAQAITLNPLRLFADPWAVGLLNQAVLSISTIRAHFYETTILDHLCPDALTAPTESMFKPFQCPVLSNGLECCRMFNSIKGVRDTFTFVRCTWAWLGIAVI
jgi:hypothetical protein